MNYVEIKEKMRKLNEEKRKAAQEFFTKAASELFQKFSDLKSFSWNQYTPYFNDGDECVFSVHEYGMLFNGIDEDEPTYDELKEEYDEVTLSLKEAIDTSNYEKVSQLSDKLSTMEYPEREANLPCKEAQAACKALIFSFDDSDMKYLFGDHCQITVTKDGVTVEKYSHD